MIETTAAARAYQGLDSVLRSAAPAPGEAVHEGAKAFAAALDGADAAAAGFVAGRADTQAMVEAVAQAEAALQTVITVRDRIVAAYQEVLRMPL